MKRNQLLNRVISLGLVGILYLSLSASAYADVEETNTENTSEAVSSESADPSDLGQNTGEPEGGGGNSINDGDVVGVDGNSITTSDSNQGGTDLDLPKDVNNIDNENQDVDGKNPEDNEAPENEENPEDTDSEEADDENAEDDELSEEDLQWDLDGDGILSEEELAAKELAEAEALAEEEEEECEHDYLYISNKDGTHTVSCHNCDMEPFIESCEYDENGVCKKCGYKRLPDPVLIYEDEEIIITVSGAVPENADLTVKPIKKENEETAAVYTEVENQLANESDIAEADNFGFLAYDIAFIDIESGEEVEPSGDVKVSMETKTALKPADLQEGENVEKVDVDVRHFNEQTATIDNLSDQGAATLNLDDNDAVTSAEFTSDSFSTFVITWKSSNGNTYKVNVVYSYIDTDENMVGELDTESVDWNGKTHTDLVFSQVDGLIKTFSGYTYLRAIYNEQEVDRLHFYYNSNKSARYMQIKNGDTVVDEIKLNSTESNIENVLISFIYEEDISLKVTKIATGPASQDENTTYDFVIKTKSDGSTVSGATYTVGNETFTTGADGKFTLKSLETARFKNLSPGDYVITEKAINSETYSFSSFVTKTSVNDVETTVYEETTTTERKEEVTVTGDSTVDLKFRNLYKKSNTTSQEAEVSKYITYEEDEDDYRLTMKFTPPKTDINEIIYELDPEIETDDSKVDVVLVIDTSGSMKNNNRIKNVKAAVNTMAEIFVNKPKIDSRFKIVNFAKNASEATGWISALELYNKVSNDVTGGTNYEAGLKTAKTALEGARDDAKKIVIFLTDGEPTFYGTGQGAGSAFDSTALTRALTAASDITCDAFYAIGVDFSNNTYSYTHNNTTASITRRQILEMICEKVDTEETSVSTVSSEDIQELFENLASKIESVAVGDYTSNSYTYRATNVVLTDPLSEYVEIQPNSEFYIDVAINGVSQWQSATYTNGKIGADGKQINGATFNCVDDGTTYVLEANYDANSKTMTLTLPPDYKANPTYGYSVSFRVTPSAKAYEEFNTSDYPHVGDPFTDNINATTPISAGKAGFYSNDFKDDGETLAVVTYNYKSKAETKLLPRPVIQVNLDWNLFKVDGTSDANKLGGASFRLEEIEVADGATPLTYQGKSSNEDANKGEVIWYGLNESTGAYDVETTIAAGHKYKMTEITAPTNYLVSEEYWIIEVKEGNAINVEKHLANGSTEVYTVEPQINGTCATYDFNFINLKYNPLPNTGGSGVYKTTVAGIMLLLAAAWMHFMMRRARRVAEK